jgi:hypothetical protein
MNIALMIAIIFSLATTLAIFINYFREFEKFYQRQKKIKYWEKLNEKENSPEKSFEMEFAFWAKISRMLYLKIPDPIMTQDKLNSMKRRGQSDEFQRPCDGILITKKGNYLIECKYNYNKLLPHQEYYQGKVNEINKSIM